MFLVDHLILVCSILLVGETSAIAGRKNPVGPQGSTRIDAGDHLFVIAPASARAAVDAVFSEPARRA